MTKLAEFIKKQSIMAYMAMGIVCFSLTYYIIVSFGHINEANKEFISRCLDYTNSALILIIGYYFGSARKREIEGENHHG